ncbi:DeoR/GlpR family DNA-binding transcription regulator [Metabacillus rhizolycopersici]|uniref:DeoR/GlpR family DNA-binding transcription regulator n=1 Tax=Metabacillus rhizolycopersici TaxID=2875709 RepID=A0ABS7UYV3_9BACI|nr:DeoR/GlpR family DNA-binding transcription regulator [Metabacillus rhizolycopersici]MBZ5753502.1 DeoR/GlpR family DNA-binding transcription regulator [Metabacillus rhizolycopersici]
MLTSERHQAILQLLKEKEVVKLQDLTEETDASESTIRRDLSQLEEQQLLKRVHGGASLLKKNRLELSVPEKSSKNIQEKKVIAQYAASLVEEGDCIFLDAGTTTFEMISYLIEKDIVIVTNGLMHLPALIESHMHVYLVGGKLKRHTGAMIGKGAILSLQQYCFDKCFIGVNGIHLQYGYTTPDTEEAMIKQIAMSLSREAFIIADDSKLSETSFSKIADIHEAAIITNEHEENKWELYQEKTTVEVVRR